MKVELIYDAELDVWTLHYVKARIETLADVREWERQLRGAVTQFPKRIDLLVDVSELELSPAMSAEYGALVKELIPRYTLGTFRYGNPPAVVQAAIQVQAMVNGFTRDIYPDRASALDDLLTQRRLRS